MDAAIFPSRDRLAGAHRHDGHTEEGIKIDAGVLAIAVAWPKTLTRMMGLTSRL
jgi:hypothetical protein